MRPKLRIGLRLKLLVLSAFLFTIPLLGYQYVWEMEKYLRLGQEKTLVGTVRAVATALHERPKLFDRQASFLPSVEKGRDLYAYPIVDPVQLDGQLDDWRNRHYALTYQEKYVLQGQALYRLETLSFEHMVGKYRQYLYAYFDVTDEDIVYRDKNSLRIDNNDLLQIAFITPAGDFRRYLINTAAPGWLTAYELKVNSDENIPIAPEARIQGVWKETAQGYTIELRLPLELLGSQLSFAITDVDKNRKQNITVGTAQFLKKESLGTVLVPSPEIESILKGLGHSESRIWVVDQHGRVLAQAGNINNSSGIWSKMADLPEKSTWYSPIKTKLKQLYKHFLTIPPSDFKDNFNDVSQLEGSHLTKALNGEVGATWRLTSDNKAVILSAAYPIYSDGQVLGAVVAEETTNGIRSLRNKALQDWFNIILLVMVLGTLALFLFASRISSRIRSLSQQTQHAIDDQGRIVSPIARTTASDEIGDLQRSFADMVTRLSDYTLYLQGMSARLSHELRTPVAIVKSSLESLVMALPESENQVYMLRAKEGITRLSAILTLLSEATRLEQSIANTDKFTFKLNEIVSGCVQGFQITRPNKQFEYNGCQEILSVNGNADLLAQLMDKLLSNAVEFSKDGSVIKISLEQELKYAVITIENIGLPLPQEMQERLFDSMVSVRGGQQHNEPHLGFGLYIARLITQFHSGSISIDNNNRKTGVEVKVKLPLL